MSNFRIYDCLNWIQIMHGLRMFDTQSIKKIYNQHYQHHRESDENYLAGVEAIVGPGWLTCREAVNLVRQSSTATTYKL
jgi:hypothetical protein